MSVRAKFRVSQITRSEGSRQAGTDPVTGRAKYEPCELRTIHMTPVCGSGDPNHENTMFWNASPSGKLELGCVNMAAAEQFEIGQEFYLDFTPAPTNR